MRLKTFLFLIFLGAIFSAVGWLVIIFYVDPNQAGLVGKGVFYLTLFWSLLGILFLAGNFLRAKLTRKQIIYNRLNAALRQAVFFATLIVGWAFLQSRQLASFLNIILLILLLTVLEFFFVNHAKKSQINHERETLTT